MATAEKVTEVIKVTLELTLEEAQDLMKLMGPIKAVGTSYEVYSALYDLLRG